MSEKLEKARLYEIEEAKNIPQEEKPAFHVSAPVGWINDPNGFSVFKGKVHLFYQYHPYSRDWGPMHWGHSVTEDMSSFLQRLHRIRNMIERDAFPEVLLKRMENRL